MRIDFIFVVVVGDVSLPLGTRLQRLSHLGVEPIIGGFSKGAQFRLTNVIHNHAGSFHCVFERERLGRGWILDAERILLEVAVLGFRKDGLIDCILNVHEVISKLLTNLTDGRRGVR